MSSAALDPLMTLLWPNAEDLSGDAVYWLLDGARDPEIVNSVRRSGLEFSCLYSGQLTPSLEAAAPHLVRLIPTSPSTRELLERGWGHAWGIFILAPPVLPMLVIRLHLKKFLRVRTEDKKLLMFRYYDPRVLSVFLPTCTDEEFTKFLGPLNRLLVELDEGARWNLFDLEDQAMRIVSGRQ
ncbi:DUF4123 domain-containing protein [Pseudomonas sp. MWU13-2100]|uniref:DUF4123 domain-containing protein n=1 Tax=Pseudomonas sp. MWU13-2100 TaxID=2935075 RepID=UPI00200DD793|nr:DUF4123 domain-containing protein [Pseudomonas sp. MWU13-2100]